MNQHGTSFVSVFLHSSAILDFSGKTAGWEPSHA
jgi:hypothetical protein